jgi:hypothetical protein
MGINEAKDSKQYLVHRITAAALESELVRAELFYRRTCDLMQKNDATIARLQDRLATY